MVNPDTRSSRLSKVPKWLRLLVGIPVICSLSCGSMYWLSEIRPQYIVLDVSPPPGIIRDWYNVQEIVWSMGMDKVFIRRLETRYSTNEDWETVVAYFDDQLAEMGWERDSFGGNNACAIYLPEARFLPLGADGYISYREALPHGNIGGVLTFAVPTVCLAIYGRGTVLNRRSFEIVLISGNPTLLTSARDYWSF